MDYSINSFNVGFDYDSDYDDRKPLNEYGQWLWSIIELWEKNLEEPAGVYIWQTMKTCRYWADWFPRDYRIMAGAKDFVQYRPTAIQFAWDPILFWYLGKPTVEPQAGRRDWFVSKTSRFVLEESTGHPCPRPIDICGYIIQECSEVGAVLDPFLGSGTTLIAADQLDRICYGLEIAPKYCDVIVKRYINHSMFGSAGVSVERNGETLSWEEAERKSKLPKVI